jgi:hypothetical protein
MGESSKVRASSLNGVANTKELFNVFRYLQQFVFTPTSPFYDCSLYVPVEGINMSGLPIFGNAFS